MILEWLASAGKAFAAIAPVELPDKTFVATLVLATRYRPLVVWLGVASAFAVHCAIAVAAGSLLGLLPALPVRLAAAVLFAVGAVVMVRADRVPSGSSLGPGVSPGSRSTRKGKADTPEYADRVPGSRMGFVASFGLLFMAEWGDLSQLFTAGLVASGEPPVPVFVGAWAALAAVSGAAVLAGRWILRQVRLSVVRYVAAGVCAVLAVVTALSAFS